MYFDVMHEQPLAAKILRNHLTHERVAQTYLITGDAASGKDDLAKIFACALLCERNRIFTECDCRACTRTWEGVHPDFVILGMDVKAKSIKIEEVRQTLGQAALKPFEASRKIFWIKEADRLTQDASNVFLKTLEEPVLNTVFILTAENKANLLETIQSRCFEIRLRPGRESGLDLDELPAGLGHRSWIEVLDEYQDANRVETASFLAALLQHFREKYASGEADLYPVYQAMEKTLEVKDALDQNVNQKLLLTRLTMHLERLIPVG